jgi:hypothetical protein
MEKKNSTSYRYALIHPPDCDENTPSSAHSLSLLDGPLGFVKVRLPHALAKVHAEQWDNDADASHSFICIHRFKPAL